MTKMVLRIVTAMMSACMLGGNVSDTDTSALVLNETQTVSALKQTASVASAVATVSVASAESSDTTMVRVCQCKEHFVMEGDWKTAWKKHVIQAHGGACHWGDNALFVLLSGS